MRTALLSTWLLAPLLFAQPTPVDGGVVATRRRAIVEDDALNTQCDFGLLEVIGANKQAFIECADAHRKKEPGVRGTLMMQWTLLPNGKAGDVSVRTQQFKTTIFAACITGVIQRLTFPPRATKKNALPEKPQVVSFPFKF